MASFKLIALAVLALFAVFANAYPRYFILDDGIADDADLHRVRRDDAAVAASSDYAKSQGYTKGRVGPVYTFVKTDPKANFKWGVRHQVGAQYGRR